MTTKGLASDCTVLVLSDFSAINPILQSMRAPGFLPDWAELETANFLNGIALGTAGNQIAKALPPSPSFPAAPSFRNRLACSRLLLWNYFPFLRDGSTSVGMVGLPAINPGWIALCNELLCRFVKATRARQVIIACNQVLRTAIGTPACLPPSMPVYHLRHPRSWTNPIVRAVDPVMLRDLLLNRYHLPMTDFDE